MKNAFRRLTALALVCCLSGCAITSPELKPDVPVPGAEVIVTSPPRRSATARARNTPRPIPFPAGLVVKNGSPTRASTSAGMP